MTMDASQNTISELDGLLEQERAALLKGDLDTVLRLLELKEGLIDRLRALEAADRPDLGQVQEKVTRNQALLNSALEGIRAVAERMADMRRVREGLETYDRRGRKTHITAGTRPSVERRA